MHIKYTHFLTDVKIRERLNGNLPNRCHTPRVLSGTVSPGSDGRWTHSPRMARLISCISPKKQARKRQAFHSTERCNLWEWSTHRRTQQLCSLCKEQTRGTSPGGDKCCRAHLAPAQWHLVLPAAPPLSSTGATGTGRSPSAVLQWGAEARGKQPQEKCSLCWSCASRRSSKMSTCSQMVFEKAKPHMAPIPHLWHSSDKRVSCWPPQGQDGQRGQSAHMEVPLWPQQ